MAWQLACNKFLHRLPIKYVRFDFFKAKRITEQIKTVMKLLKLNSTNKTALPEASMLPQ